MGARHFAGGVRGEARRLVLTTNEGGWSFIGTGEVILRRKRRGELRQIGTRKHRGLSLSARHTKGDKTAQSS